VMYLVTYQLKPSRDTSRIEEELKLYPTEEWAHFLDFQFALTSREDINALTARIRRHMTPLDSILIVRVSPTDELQGWMAPQFWEWVNARRYG
jgi:hypothetical protein